MSEKLPAITPPAALEKLLQAEPDLVDRIFDYILTEFPAISEEVNKIKGEVRKEFAGEECYIAGRPATLRQEQVSQVLALFNGRNASEVARRLHIGRTTVYRILRQQGGVKTVPDFREMAHRKR